MLEYLGPYIEDRIRRKGGDRTSTSQFLNTKLVQHYLVKYRRLRLKQALSFTYEHSRFYHDTMKKHHVHPNDIKTFDDVSKIPLTSSKDLHESEPFFAVPPEQFIKVFSSSGTTGPPKRVYFTQKDLQRQISSITIGLRMMYRLTEKDVARITYDHGYGIDDWGVRYCMGRATESVGAMTVFTGTRLPAQQELQALQTYKATVLMGTPSYLNSLTHEVQKEIDPKTLSIKTMLVGTEPLPKSMRKNLESTWNTKVFQGYGLTEMGTSVAGECQQQDGMHVTESDFLVEVIDPKTEELLEPGEEGELVFTTLSREGMPFLRYRTRDLGVILKEPCPCGLPFKRIKIKGRTDAMITIGSGDNIYPEAFNKVLFKLPYVIEFQLVLTKKENKDVVTVVIETNKATPQNKKEVLNQLNLLPEIDNGLNDSKTIHSVEVKFVKPNTIKRTGVKAKRIIDNRHLYE